ncbi:MAG: penicillin-binding protein [Cellulomonadaceae bacterium]|nr:penicillin-binding protein [Cellulomonadaceae bacterium]
MVSSVPARPRGRQVNALQALALLLAFVLMASLGGVLSAGLVMPAVGAASSLTTESVSLFDELPTVLEQVPLSEKSTIYAADGTVLATFYTQNRIVVSLDQIAPIMRQAVIATEDKRFYEHGGVDLLGMGRALMENIVKKDGEGQQGGSTLTQQYVKNALIQAAQKLDDPVERANAIAAARESSGVEGYARKLQEAKLAVALEETMTKDEILEAYLNISQFGVSVYGVEAAAQHYFSVSAANLNYLQAATIAGITKGPSEYDPERDPAASEGRRNTVLGLMRDQEVITQAEYDAGIATPIAATLAIGQTQLGCTTANGVANAGYFCDYVTKVIAQNTAFGDTAAKRSQLLYAGGLQIHTTLDVRLQGIADAAVKGTIPVDDPSGMGTAMSVVEPGTGKILAMAQNRIYNPQANGTAGETAVNFNTDNGYGSSSGFPPGSTFKPFTLVEWLKEGHALREVIDGRLINTGVPMSEFHASCTGFSGGVYKFGNAEGSGGVMTVLDATRNSVNSAYMEMATKIDLCGMIDGATSLGIHRAGGLAGEGPFEVLPSNVIGTNSVAPLTMAAAFAAFAANGTFCEPIAITSVQDTNGAELTVPSANCRQAISPEIAAAVTYAMSFVWQGTAKDVDPLPGGRVSSGKTGTTSANEHTWFVGYTPQMSTAVWVGHSEGMIPAQRVWVNGRFYKYVYGSSLAAPEWRAFMSAAHEGLPELTFPAPPSTLVDGVKVTVPDVTGKSPSDAKAILTRAGFNVSTGSTVYSSAAPGSVAGTEPGAGARVTRGTLVKLQISQGPDPAQATQTSNGPGDNNGKRNGG